MAKKIGLIKNTYSLSQRASSLRLFSRAIAKCLYVGNFRSMYRGRGVDYAGGREYLFGDDVRSIDWNVTARMGRPYIKLFEEDKELIIFLIVDRSLSMESGFGKITRIEAATEAAVLMLFAAMQSSSPVGGILFDGETEFSCVPKAGKDHAMILFSKLDTRPQHKSEGTSLTQALRGASKLLKNRSLVLVLSDFRCNDYEDALSTLASKHDVVALRITDDDDVTLPKLGTVRFFDSETKKEKTLPTNSPSFEREWKSYHERHVDRWHSFCAKRRISTLAISTSQDPAQELVHFFSTRRKM